MSDKKKNYAFSLTDTRNNVSYNVVWSALWKLEDPNGIILPKSEPKPYAYAYNVFRAEQGWIGGGSFIVLDHRPNEQDAMQALGIVLQHEVNNAAQQADAHEAAPEGDDGAEVIGDAEVVKAAPSQDEEGEAPVPATTPDEAEPTEAPSEAEGVPTHV